MRRTPHGRCGDRETYFDMNRKIDFAINLIRKAAEIAEANGSELEVCYSGGKDSDVVLHLAQRAGVKFCAIYKNTTIDPPGTIAHAEKKGVRMVRPQKTFAELIRQKGMPSRFRRHCCAVLKEYKIHGYAIVGVRRAESSKRAARYQEPEMCRKYSAKEKVKQYYPILEWTDEEVEQYIKDNGIQCHPLYYDEQGNFHVERRLGCMCCPLASRKHRTGEFIKYPGMIGFYVKNAQAHMDEHPQYKINRMFNNAEEWLAFTLLCDSLEQWRKMTALDMFGNTFNAKKWLNHTFNNGNLCGDKNRE